MFIFSFLKKSAAITLCALALVTAVTAVSPDSYYKMTEHDGRIAVQEIETGRWVYVSDVPVDALSNRDRLLLEMGISLHSRADFTTAVEDFCS